MIFFPCFAIEESNKDSSGGGIIPDGFAALGRLRVVGFGRFIVIKSNSQQVKRVTLSSQDWSVYEETQD